MNPQRSISVDSVVLLSLVVLSHLSSQCFVFLTHTFTLLVQSCFWPQTAAVFNEKAKNQSYNNNNSNKRLETKNRVNIGLTQLKMNDNVAPCQLDV